MFKMEEQKNTNETAPKEAIVEETVHHSDTNKTPDEKVSSASADEHKAMAIIGYIIPVLFFVPLVSDAKNDAFAKFHANQQLLLLISAVVVNVVGGIIPIIGWFLLLPLGMIALLVFAIMGVINASKGEMKELPLIGGINILK